MDLVIGSSSVADSQRIVTQGQPDEAKIYEDQQQPYSYGDLY